jgi:putative aldouronate transport system substrate-binding protein
LAFKRQDANGNGDPNDEIPFSWDNGNLRTFYILISAWGLQYNTPFYPDPQNPGKLTHWTLYKNGRAFTDMLTTLAQWYKEGLIDPDSFTQNNAQRLSKITNDKIGFTYVDPTNGADWRDAIKKIRPDIAGQVKFTGVAPFTGPEGKPYTHNNYMGGGVEIHETSIITQKAEKQGKTPVILKLMDYMYSDAGTTLINYGVEGVSFTKDAKGNLAWTPAMGADPQFPLKSKLIQYNLSYHGTWPKYVLHDAWVLSNLYDPDSLQIHTAYLQGDMGLVFPVAPPPLSQADAQESNRIMNDVNTAVNEFYVAVISGRRSVSEAPALFARLQTMGLDRALEINQAHYDRTKSR